MVDRSGYIALKESMNLVCRAEGYTRPPMKMFTESQKAQLREILEDVGLLEPSTAQATAAS